MKAKFLVWDGIYKTRKGDCNSRKDKGPPRPKSLKHTPSLSSQSDYLAPAQFRQALIGLLGTIDSKDLRLIILAVSEEFLPVRQNMEIKFSLSPISKAEHLLLRIYDRGDRPVYEELIEGNKNIQGLPDEPPETEVPEGIYVKCANWADGPYRAALWASTDPIPLTRHPDNHSKKDREKLQDAMETEINQNVTAIIQDLDSGVVPAALNRGRPNGETLNQVHGDMRGLRWFVTGNHYDYVVTKVGSRLVVDLFYEPVPARARIVHDQCSRGKIKTGEPTAVGRNESKVKLPKVKCAAYQVPTMGWPGGGTACWLKVALEAWVGAAPPPGGTLAQKKEGMIKPRGFFDKLFGRRKPRGKPLEKAAPKNLLADAEAKVRHLFEHVLHEADGHAQFTGLEEGVQRVFIAPEFYFTHPDRPYTRSEMMEILDQLKQRSADYPQWLIVAGSIWWSSPWIEEQIRRDFSSSPVAIVYAHAPGTDREVEALIREAAKVSDELGMLLNCKYRREGADWRVDHPPRIKDVRMRTVGAPAGRLEIYHGTLSWKPAQGASPREAEPRYANVVYNTVPVLYDGRIIYTQQKNHASTIDGLKGWTDTDTSAEDIVADHITRRQPLRVDWETWNRWIHELEGTQIKVEGQGVFYLNGLLCGVEICLDHLHTVLRNSCARLPSARARTGVDLHLLVAAGMPKKDASIAARERGLLLRCDGGYPSERYSSAFKKQPGGGNITELAARTEVILNNPVSNRLNTEVQSLRNDMEDARDDWRVYSAWAPAYKATHLRYKGTPYLRTALTAKQAKTVEEHLDRGKNWEAWNLDPRDSLAIYNDLVDIND